MQNVIIITFFIFYSDNTHKSYYISLDNFKSWKILLTI